jgi:FMN reductase
VIGLISTAGGVQGLQAINAMEFTVRALRGWAVPMVMPIPQAWMYIGPDGKVNDPALEEMLRALGREVVRAARKFAIAGINEYATPVRMEDD